MRDTCEVALRGVSGSGPCARSSSLQTCAKVSWNDERTTEEAHASRSGLTNDLIFDL